MVFSILSTWILLPGIGDDCVAHVSYKMGVQKSNKTYATMFFGTEISQFVESNGLHTLSQIKKTIT